MKESLHCVVVWNSFEYTSKQRAIALKIDKV